jgi:hypothetical protein
MFELTITGETAEQLARNLMSMAADFRPSVIERDAEDAMPRPKPKATKSKAVPTPEPEQEEEVNIDAVQADAELKAAIAADERTVQPMPETAKGTVDAGTGQPADAPIKMTMDDVKAAAAKLAAKDTPKLAEILKKYKAGKLSEVKGADMGDFAADVMAELG